MKITEYMKEAVNEAIGESLASEIQTIVYRQTKLAFREHEEEFNLIITNAIKQALNDIFKGEIE